MRWRLALIVTIAAFLLPFPITWLFKLTGGSLGPVVVGYSGAAGIVVASCWFRIIRRGFGRAVAWIACIPIALIGSVLLLNAFIGITALLGAMNYELM
jgi:hypothetical protein